MLFRRKRWGKRRWQIEGWFKTAKHRFGLHRFGQGTLLGMYRWIILSLIAFHFNYDTNKRKTEIHYFQL